MAIDSRSSLIRKRNILGAVMVAGVGLGLYLGKLNFGIGGGKQIGVGTSGSGADVQVSVDPAEGKRNPPEAVKEEPEAAKEEEALPTAVPDVVRILIDDRQYYLRSENGGGGDVPIALPKLIELVTKSPGDEDGLRVRVYQKTTARASAEDNLKKALEEAGINEAAIFWVPTPAK